MPNEAHDITLTSADTHPLVLVVDDDLDTRELYRVILDSAGYETADASTTGDARGALASIVPDVVMTDWLLPDGNGFDVCDAVRARAATRQTPVVAVTGMTLTAAQHADARARGCVAIIEKPASPDVVLLAVGQALAVATERRVRAAAERARRYAERVGRGNRQLAGGADGSRHSAAALLARAAERSDGSVTLMIADNSARYIAVGGATRELTGYDEGELAKMSVWDLTPIGDPSQSQHLWRQFIEAGVQEGPFHLRRRDGQVVTAQYCAIANILPGLHVSALAQTTAMPESLAAI